MRSLDAVLYCLKGWGRNKLLKDEDIESSPNCCIIHLTFSKCQSLITDVLKIRAVIQFKLCYICEPEPFHYLIISHSNNSSFSTFVKGSVPRSFFSWEPVIHVWIFLFHVCLAFMSMRVYSVTTANVPVRPSITPKYYMCTSHGGLWPT